ncbi:MAG: YdeI/OmpD-associated family protein [Anaerolineae bacterium]|nr:YdeI/OmpD-associated family protein [Anaerolineae bacterium]
MAKKTDNLERYYARDRQEWRDWLAQNHATSPGVWLIYYKKESSQPHVEYADAVEEALCFGWIDSTARKLDDERYMQFFSPRKPKSVWSKPNKQRVERLIQQGLMTPVGLEKIEAAQQDGSWDALNAVDELIVPADLQAALDANESARVYFEAFSNSSRKMILWWIESAKRPETRAKRIAETVTLAAQNIKANHYR